MLIHIALRISLGIDCGTTNARRTVSRLASLGCSRHVRLRSAFMHIGPDIPAKPQHDQHNRTELEELLRYGTLYSVRLSRLVKLIDFFGILVRRLAGILAPRWQLAIGTNSNPFMKRSGLRTPTPNHVHMLIDQAPHKRIKQHRMLSNKNDINPAVPVHRQISNVRNLIGLSGFSERELRFIDNDD